MSLALIVQAKSGVRTFDVKVASILSCSSYGRLGSEVRGGNGDIVSASMS
jgi:hypothetical protein